ncbi:MAG: choice-of-anchor D domain-containing protein, partial [Gammaproteobacteria bacterium]|nr:choice-of-anchor D domain-containing protein [Gammaproteobacteria bacterium]
GATGDATASGSFNLLAAGGSDSASLVVGVDTSTAGAKSGTASIGLVSDGSGTSGLGQTAMAGQTVNVSGGVYRLAEATIDNPLDFAFGNIHVGDTVNQAVSITNTAVSDVYSEKLNASFGGTSDARITTNGGSFNQLAAGATDSSMEVGVDTSAAGIIGGTATLNFASDGTGTSGLGITGLPSQDLIVTASISATAYNYAEATINTTQPVDFGNSRVGDVLSSQALSITNSA